jgi:hypothetical protein
MLNNRNQALRALVGIKNPDGTIRVAFCPRCGVPAYAVKVLAENYGDEQSARKLISGGDFGGLEDIQSKICYEPIDCPELRQREFTDIYELVVKHQTGVISGFSYAYIFCDGTWTSASFYRKEVVAQDFFGKSGEVFSKVDSRSIQPYPLFQWIEEFFPSPKVVAPTLPRLSKDDWLRQHYPELSELPKWRFPCVSALS